MLGGTEAYVSDLIVRRDQRGRGVGRRLVAVVEAEARRRGCVRVMLNNRIAAESFRRSFYLKLGFRVRDDFANLVKALS
jgi:GNAT superfamily N-acetyltransferase